jgi:drug/metabolite transporter (DMT)-like permease
VSGAARGVLLLLASMFVLSLTDACNKRLAHDYDPMQIVWFRYLVFSGFAAWFCRRRGLLRTFASRRPLIQVARSLMAVAQNALVVASLAHMPLAEVMALMAASPLLATLLAAPLLGERVGPRRWIAIAVAFAGVLVILRPGFAIVSPWALATLLAAVMFAGYQLLTRLVSAQDPLETTLLLTATPALFAVSFATPFVWRAPDGLGWTLLLAAGAGASLGHFIMIKALKLAEASVLQPFNYSILLWAALLGFALFGETPDFATICGGALIVASGVYAFRAAAPPAAMRPAAAHD